MQPLGVGAARKGFAGSPFCGDTAICAWPCEIKNTVCPWNIYIYYIIVILIIIIIVIIVI